MFFPTEIIFAPTSQCNLKCQHCYVNRNPVRIETSDAIKFIQSAKQNEECTVEKIGFSGGEPFLHQDFLESVIKESVAQGFMFDKIMTNGVWWKTEKELSESLRRIYDAGFDGKIGLSWDYFHAQEYEKIKTFVKKTLKTFGEESLEIQSVVPYERKDALFVRRNDNRIIREIKRLAQDLDLSVKNYTNFFSKRGMILLEGKKALIHVYRTPQSFPCSDGRGWKSRKWFKEDFCENLGQILYIHPDGKIAPCCGFANEDKKLIIGNIRQTYDEVVLNAEVNPMIKLCFETGLLSLAEKLERNGKLSRKTDDSCTFCDYVCKYGLK